ncbi:hypothetical protein GCM10009733_006620 [Nonomuraea maheshkhaliensis]|uniref:Uncharacterized protein n=2 Tax=Nonomuraea maheshkhaliensis TaxID=419590 RepID=A0ABN2ENX7_9ACTN
MEHDESNVDEPGYVEARRDEFGPFVQVRWGSQVSWRVRAWAWAWAWEKFLRVVSSGVYSPERLRERRDGVEAADNDDPPQPVAVPGAWVRFTISEELGQVTLTGWKPKIFDVPQKVRDQFVTAARAGAFNGLARDWRGLPCDNGEQRETHDGNGP